MKTWTREEAIKTLTQLVCESDELASSKVWSAQRTRWAAECLDTLEEVFGPASRHFLSFAAIRWGTIPHGTVIAPLEYGGSYQSAEDGKQHEYFLRHLETAKGLLQAAAEYLKWRELSDVYESKDATPESSLILKVLNLAQHQLRKVIRNKPEKESQVQDAFENLLIGGNVPYARETDSIEYSSKTYIPDFSLPKMSLAIELKLCNREGREKEIIAEINDDILAYQTKCQNLVFVIYDLGYIRDQDRFSGSFSQHDNVTVRIVKH